MVISLKNFSSKADKSVYWIDWPIDWSFLILLHVNVHQPDCKENFNLTIQSTTATKQTFTIEGHVFYWIDTSRPKFNVMTSKRAEKQARPVWYVIHVHCNDLESFATEKYVGGFISRTVLWLLIINHWLWQPNCGRRLLVVSNWHHLNREQIVEPYDVARLVQKKFYSIETKIFRKARVEWFDDLRKSSQKTLTVILDEFLISHFITSQYPKKEWSAVLLQLIVFT